MKTAPVISLGVLCDNGCTITLYKRYISVPKSGQEIIKGTKKKQIGIWEVPLETQQSEAVANKICPRQLNQNWNSTFMQNFSVRKHKSYSRQSNKDSWRLGQASQKISLRSILKHQGTQQWDTGTLEDKDCNQPERNLQIYT